MKEKKVYLDLLRVLAILMVFHFHFVLALGDGQGMLVKYASGDWGCVGTTLFFLISGNCLARNYGEKLDVKKFYAKRFLAIFPAFYICYLLVWFGHTAVLQNHVLGGVEPWRMIFTLLGIDNYMNFYGIRNAALVGEWYTAVILIIYLLFPALQFLYRKNKALGTTLVLTLYGANLAFGKGMVPADAHVLTGICMFWLGMMIYHFEKELENMSWIVWTALVILGTVFLFITVPGPQLMWKNAMAICIFLVLMRLGKYLNKENKIIGFLGKIEFAVYLCHHSVMYVMRDSLPKVLPHLNIVVSYVLCLAATIVFATLITYLTKWVLKKFKIF